MSQAEQITENLISENKVVVFSKTYCPYCTKAKQALTQLGIEFHAIELDNESDGAAIQQYLLSKTGQRTVPNIFINEKHVGGCDDLLKAIKSGAVQKLLQ